MSARADLAARLYGARRERDTVFAAYLDGLGEPMWDMMLALYVTDCGGQSIGIERLIGMTVGSKLVARRYLTWMESQRLVRIGDDADATIALLETGRQLMDSYLDREAGTASSRAAPRAESGR